MDDQALAIAVKELVGGGAAQPRAHRPDVRLDDAMAELIVERADRELRQNIRGVFGRHAVTFSPDGASCKPPSAPLMPGGCQIGRSRSRSARRCGKRRTTKRDEGAAARQLEFTFADTEGVEYRVKVIPLGSSAVEGLNERFV